jgi:L-threonylcarbamoyladenylate synthase
MRVIVVDALHPDRAALREAARVLARGGLVAFPTETVYGLGGRALDPEAVARIFAAKGRPSSHPVIAHVVDEPGAMRLAAAWSESARRLAARFWPGPLTLVVPRADGVPAALGGGTASIGIRAPAHPVARGLIRELGEPIAAPSANRYQGLSPTRAAHVVDSLGDAVELVIDAGSCDVGLESTVLDLRADPPVVLRPGAVSLPTLREVVPDVTRARSATVSDGSPRASPGMDPRHYAPRARLELAGSREGAHATADREARRGHTVGLVLRGGSGATTGRFALRVLPDEPEAYGQSLYAVLHELDALRVDAIVVQSVPDGEAWDAIRDRLTRASKTPPS